MRPPQALRLSLLGTGGLIALAAGSGVLLRRGAAAVSHEQPPYVPPPLVAAIPEAKRVALGRALFVKSCAHCHGLDATGDEGPDLHGLWVSDRRIASVVKRGIKGEMPSFAKKHDDRDVAELVAYVRTLQ